MAYRETATVRERKQAVRRRILDAARAELAEGGFRATQIARVARHAGIATGTLYRYFPAKAELYAEVFRLNSGREVEAFAAAAAGSEPAAQRLVRAIRQFAQRALRARRVAYALIAEPVDPRVEAERLVYRRAYARVLEELLRTGMQAGEFPRQDPRVVAAALVGALAEALLGPLSTPESELSRAAERRLVHAITEFSLRAAGGTPAALEHLAGEAA